MHKNSNRFTNGGIVHCNEQIVLKKIVKVRYKENGDEYERKLFIITKKWSL